MSVICWVTDQCAQARFQSGQGKTRSAVTPADAAPRTRSPHQSRCTQKLLADYRRKKKSLRRSARSWHCSRLNWPSANYS